MNVSGADGGSFIMKKLYPLRLFFSGGLSGVAQKKIRGSFIRKKLYPLHLFLFDWGSQGLSGAAQGHIGGSFINKSYANGIYFSLNTGGLIDLWIRNNN